MDKYFADILGINKDYLTGLDSLIKGGQGAANSITSLLSNAGNSLGQAAFGSAQQSNKMKQQLMSALMMLAFMG
jgi:hypothetical protein